MLQLRHFKSQEKEAYLFKCSVVKDKLTPAHLNHCSIIYLNISAGMQSTYDPSVQWLVLSGHKWGFTNQNVVQIVAGFLIWKSQFFQLFSRSASTREPNYNVWDGCAYHSHYNLKVETCFFKNTHLRSRMQSGGSSLCGRSVGENTLWPPHCRENPLLEFINSHTEGLW